jgi:hypothetical protein
MSAARAVAATLLVLLPGCSLLYETESVWELAPIVDAAERVAAAQRMAALLAPDPAGAAVARDGDVVRVTLTGDAAEAAWRAEETLADAVLGRPVPTAWSLRVRTRLVGIDGVRWFERVHRPPATRPAESRPTGT